MSMDFIDSCKNKLNTFECGKISFYGDDYYSLECIKLLPGIIEKMGLLDELLITPYYFINGEMLELYEYKLSIVNTVLFFLIITGIKFPNDAITSITLLDKFQPFSFPSNDTNLL